MKKQKLILLSLILVAILASAGVLYNLLGDQLQPDGLTTLPTIEETEPETTTEASTDAATDTQPEQTTEPARQAAPDFTVVDAEGNEYRLSDFVGKPVVLNFWASWCGPCKSEMPEFEEAYQQYGEDVCFLMVNLTDGYQETVDSAASFITEQGYTFPVYFDTAYSAASAYGVNAVPVTYFIDAEGNLVAYAQGALQSSTLEKGIGMILSE